MNETGRTTRRLRSPSRRMFAPTTIVLGEELLREGVKLATFGQNLPGVENAWIQHGGDAPIFIIAEVLYNASQKLIKDDDLRKKVVAGFSTALVLFAESPLNHIPFLFGTPDYADAPIGIASVAGWFLLRSYFERRSQQKERDKEEKIQGLGMHMATFYVRTAGIVAKRFNTTEKQDNHTQRILTASIGIALANIIAERSFSEDIPLALRDELLKANEIASTALMMQIFPAEMLGRPENEILRPFFISVDQLTASLRPILDQGLLRLKSGRPINLETVGNIALQNLNKEKQRKRTLRNARSRRTRPKRVEQLHN